MADDREPPPMDDDNSKDEDDLFADADDVRLPQVTRNTLSVTSNNIISDQTCVSSVFVWFSLRSAGL